MANQTVLTGGTGIDVRDFHDVARALRRAAPESSRQLRRKLRDAGELVAVEARAIAEKHSKKIPPTIKVRTLGATVEIVAGGEGIDIAGLFELGNTGGARRALASSGGSFRHPVFGNRDVWVTQPMHPYLTPAAVANARRLEETVVAALDDAARIIEFEGRHA